ncbi:MAG: UPF0175 family protein [Firmicutes bacterium]|nr:UPF0175 family protein [Bacillota bacterium]
MKEIKVPDELVKFYGVSEELLAQRALFLMVLDLLRQKKITSGKAAQLLGVSRHDILDVMGQYGIPVVNYSSDALEKELDLWEKLKIGAK